jgi:hypothetical protein
VTTAQQRSFYFPAWNRAAAVHGWKASLKGADLRATRKATWGGPEVDKVYGKLWFIALGLADLEERDVCAADLRHACNLAATGKKRHSEDLNNKETNRVVALLELLVDPENLAAMNAWLHPDAAAREGVRVQIRKLAPLAYIISVSRGKFSRDDWENLPDHELSQLLFTLKARARSSRTATRRPAAPEPQTVEAPF